jgi:hypothetical protein
MEKLEQYLDQVCRSIGGPRDMREHVRQELREHLLDAVAQHKAAGLSEADALQKALDEFGKPEEVRSELEAAHGKRTMWLIDKALDWKEMTMRAKWLWLTWAHLAVLGVIALEVLFITFTVLMLIPKIQKLMHDGYIDTGELREREMMWMVNFLHELSYVCGHYTWLFILIPGALWGLFEWRVQSDNKSFMRLSALGTVALALMVVIFITAAGMVIPYLLAAPAMGVMARPWAVERVNDMDAAFTKLEKAQKEKDWPEMQKHARDIAGLAKLLTVGPAIMSLAPHNELQKAGELRGHAHGIEQHALEMEKAIREHDERRLEAAMTEFRKSFPPLREAAKAPR